MKYKNNCLDKVIFQINYCPLLELRTSEKNAATSFHDMVKEEFPQLDFSPNRQFKTEYENTGKENKTEKKFHNWTFLNENEKYLKLNFNEMLLVYPGKVYKNFKNFSKDIELSINALKEFDIKGYYTMGLRYVNKIKIKDRSSINEYLNPKLNLVNDEFSKNQLVQSITRTDLRIDYYDFIFQYGEFNETYYGTVGDKYFILDYDCITHNEEYIEFQEKELKKMHEIIYNRFEHDIQDKLREEMI